MTIKDITKNKKNYIILFDNGLSMEIFEDTIIEFYLRKDMNVNEELFNKIKDSTLFYSYYNQALTYILKGEKPISKIKNYLRNKECNEELISKIIDSFISKGLLDDKRYFEILSSYYIRRNYGPYYIRAKAKSEQIDDIIVDEVMSYYNNNDYYNSISVLINKYLKTNREQDLKKVKEKLKKYLYQRGYSIDMVIEKVEEYFYENR
jgi:SOS response regulatory protein OraA/RecX